MSQKEIKKYVIVENKKCRIDDIEFSIKYSARRTMGIIISPDSGVVVRVPYRTGEKEIGKMIREKAVWIRKVLSKHETLLRLDNNKSFTDGGSVLFMGNEHFLKLVPSERYYIRKAGDAIIEVGIDGRNDPGIIKAMMESWFKIIARKTFIKMFRDILTKYHQYDFQPVAFSVRKMKKRWGSCTINGRIGISADLIRLDMIYAEYVIIHELCHLRHHNHGKEFYRLLSELFPGWKPVRQELGRIIR